MFGTALSLIGLQTVQAQVTIDVAKITCNQYLAGEVTDARTLGIWLNGYVNGARAKALIEPLAAGHISWSNIARTTSTRWFWMLPEKFLVATNRLAAVDFRDD
jgi:hypothetical protein